MYDISSLDRKFYTAEYFLENSTCRLCWSSDAKIEIMARRDENTASRHKQDLVDIISANLDILISPETLPNKVCSTCIKNIEYFQSFRNFCKEADKRLREILPEPSEVDAAFIKNEKYEYYCEKTDITIMESQSHRRESIDEFLDALCPSGSDDELPLKDLRQKRNQDMPIKKERLKKKKQSDTYCNICKMQFECIEVFSRHNSESHGVENGWFKCFGCEKKMKTRRGRASHETYFCKALNNGYKCEKCEKLLPSRRYYEKHMKNHRENVTEIEDVVVKCSKCCKTFSTREEMKIHAQQLHGDKKSYICERCGRAFTRRDYLNKHKLTHTGAKTHICVQCGFRAAQKSTLTVHMRKHSGERPYSCDLCPQRCVSSSNLRAHRRMHSGVKKYECTLCNKKFGYKMSLEEHFASTHDRSPAHTCPHCEATYSRRRGLKRHISQKHNTKNDECTTKNDETASKNEECVMKSDEPAKSDGFGSKNDELENKVDGCVVSLNRGDVSFNRGDVSLNKTADVVDNSLFRSGEMYSVLVADNIGDGVKIKQILQC